MAIASFKRPKHTRMKVMSSIRNFVWTLICLVASIAVLILLIKWCTPWFQTLGDTVMK
jgi:hypothetical protein